jgi:hypothetical protein
MASSGDATPKGTPPAHEDTTGLTTLADVASQQAPLPPSVLSSTPIATGLASIAGGAAIPQRQQQQSNSRFFVSFTDPNTGQKHDAVLVSQDDPNLTPEYVEQFTSTVVIDDNAQPLKNSEETVAKWTDDMRRKQAYRGRGYAAEIVELGVEEAREKADKTAKEKEERERAEKEEKEAKEKTEKEELERKKKTKKEAQEEEARKRKEAKKDAAARRRNFQADIKADYDLDMAVTKTGDEE